MLTINNTLDGYLKDVEIKGNTIQDAENLADIRSVGDKVEGQELYEIPVLSVGKNLFNGKLEIGMFNLTNGEKISSVENIRSVDYINIKNILNFTIKSQTTTSFRVYFYNDNKQFIKTVYTGDGKFINDVNAKYVNFICTSTDTNMQIQLEEGTVATPYEPYVEDKLTILSPVQLEKVGDVADRIIEKDGVWGVEKNIKTVYTKEFANISMYEDKGDTYLWKVSIDTKNTNVMSNFVPSGKLSTESTQTQVMIYDHTTKRELRFAFKKSDFPNFVDVSNVQEYLRDNDKYIKIVQDPQFIPLPHDQQVKLRTFANKTNISFLTEIEGTIKAQVPKSLGATVNTHTEQISNLNKELDRVKKLEESTVSTVTTESDFTTVEATSNGYFEDVKLEGKTLVNVRSSNPNDYIFNNNNFINEGVITMNANGTYSNAFDKLSSKIKPNTEYTILVDIISNTLSYVQNGLVLISKNTDSAFTEGYSINSNALVGRYIVKRTTKQDFTGVNYLCRTFISQQTISGELKLKITVIEGDHTQNPPSYFEGLKSVGDGADEIVVSSNNNQPKQIETTDDNSITTTIDNPNYQSDKKRLLYYNNETQAWEKPILRQWDSIEKHSNGKYYYHKRSGEVVLNGSESWNITGTPTDMYISFKLKSDGISSSKCVSDKLNIGNSSTWRNEECLYMDSSSPALICITILKSKLSTQDVAGFKQWLQTNPVTVVYQLAQEKVYECTNIDLITYANETNYVVNSGVLSPKSTLKVHNNISNVVSLLQKKVSLLESDITSYMITQNRLQLSSTYSADSVTFKVDYAVCSENRSQENYNTDLYNLILNNIVVGKDNYDYDHMFNIIMDYASWSQISWDQFDILVGIMDLQHNPPIEPPIEEVPSETPEE